MRHLFQFSFFSVLIYFEKYKLSQASMLYKKWLNFPQFYPGDASKLFIAPVMAFIEMGKIPQWHEQILTENQQKSTQ